MRHRRHVLRWWLGLAVVCLALAMVRPPASAQDVDSTGNAVSPPSDGYSVFIIGDALAGGLWAGTTRVGADFAEFRINGRFKEESGLARPEIYDWSQAVPKILGRNRLDIAIVFIGSNDGQDMRTAGGRLAFGSPEWVMAYEAAVDDIIRPFKAEGVAVYFVGMPPMRSARLDEAVRKVSDIQRRRAVANDAKFIDIRREFAGPDGSYAESGFGIDGQFVRLRSLNGVKFIKAGNDKLAKLVLETIRSDIGLAPAGALAPVAAEEEAATGSEQSTLPIFGQDLADGGARTLRPVELPEAEVADMAEPGRLPTSSLDLKGDFGRSDGTDDSRPSPGSSAAALFNLGRWPEPKPGRIDDFRWQP